MVTVLFYAGVVYLTVAAVKVAKTAVINLALPGELGLEEAFVPALKWPYDLVVSIINKIRG